MTNNLSETDYSDTAYLRINFPPLVHISWDNPCMGQTAHFFSDVTSDISPNSFTYEWTFGDAAEGKSVYPNPSYLYDSSGTYNVTLTVKDAFGCTASVDTTVTIYEIPDLQITGDDVVCSNEQDVQYEVNLADNNVDFEWDIKDFGTITDNSLPQINVDWNKVDSAIQTDISLRVTIHFNDTLFCITKVSKEVLITSYIAPPEGIVFRKPVNSSLLIYKDSIAGPEIKSYKWGYTAEGQDHYIKPENGGERFYCDFLSLNCADTDYWVETSYDSRIDCVTRSHYKCNTDKLGWADMTGSFKLYPVPASDYLKIKSEINHEISEIVIYNVMMQEMILKKNLATTEDGVTVSLDGLISGVYIIQITDNSGMNSFRVFNIEK
jgi:PKD repeat protein